MVKFVLRSIKHYRKPQNSYVFMSLSELEKKCTYTLLQYDIEYNPHFYSLFVVKRTVIYIMFFEVIQI